MAIRHLRLKVCSDLFVGFSFQEEFSGALPSPWLLRQSCRKLICHCLSNLKRSAFAILINEGIYVGRQYGTLLQERSQISACEALCRFDGCE